MLGPGLAIQSPCHAKAWLPCPVLDGEIKARQVIAADDRLQLELEAAIGAFGPGFLEQGGEADAKATLPCPAGVLAGHAVKPPLASAGDRKIRRINAK